MKKILLSTVVLLAFSFSLILFQISCKKVARAEMITVDTVKQQNKIVFIKIGPPSVSRAIWQANYDGSNAQKLNIMLPANVGIDGTLGASLSVSPDHKKIFFTAGDTTTNHIYDIYSANIDGSNAQKVLSDAYKVVPY